jgi:iron(III) transport system ATP-binding protein
MPEIIVRSLSKTFGQAAALSDISFSVRDKEFLTLLGPSGCGKTTTLMSIAGFLRPDQGLISCGERAFFDGTRNLCLAAEDRNLGMVFQSYAIWPHLTVFGNVAFPLKVRRAKREALRRRVLETLELVEMADLAGRYPHELSGGQQQRVALARALVYSPEVLLLDEPFSNLDAKLRERARTWLKRLQGELGLTTLFVTHDQGEALSLSDRIVVMDGGKVLQVGSPEEIYRNPASRVVADFLGRCNIMTAKVATAAGTGPPGGPAGLVLTANGEPITVAIPPAILAAGDEVQLAVRPEAVELLGPDSAAERTAESAAAENTYVAELRTVSFLGDHYLYELDVDGQPLTATSTRSVAGPSVMVRIPPSACQVLPT